ncbi:non-ribosomal peptide synthetase [Jidongwangia harbinensis]|uniref:non-ribosomal peptide synthetase n=1 Tax=Jidongwangia harbinensis TaxID=2878561 RepID=UPI001CD9FEFD|nr:non-ribosomal peptide synthetase [Jidongwangia harbinensis]MCA2211551.1 amino acid adenylation domain-containing protein [Jidongwangia harbinensis]
MTGENPRRLHELLAARLGDAARAGTRSEAPLSYAQERLWFLDRLDPGSSVYNSGFALRLTGALDRAALAGAVTGLVRRHAILRTTYRPDDTGTARQHVSPATAVPLADLELAGPEPAEDRAREVCQAFLAEPFTLATGPVLRAGLLTLDDTDHILVIGLHHIVSDGWSHPILVDELRLAYNSETVRDRPQYLDFADAQRRAADPFAGSMRFWRERLAGVPTELALPRDRTVAEASDHRGGTVPVTVPAEQAARLSRLAAAEGTTEFAVLLSAYAALLARYSGQDRFLIGFPAANRRSAGEFDTVGFFVNTLAFPVDLQDDPTPAALVSRIGGDLLDAYEHQDAPYEQVVREIGAGRDPIQAFLAWQNVPPPAGDWTGLRCADFPLTWPWAKFDLTLSLTQAGAEIHGYFEYRAAAFDRATIEQLAANWSALLNAVLAAPDRPLSALELTGDAAAPTADWLSATAYDPAGLVRADLAVDRWARSRPDRIAVRDESSVLTWAQLRDRVTGLAGRLVERGVHGGDVVGVCCGRGVGGVVAALATLRAGAAFLPLDPAAPAERRVRQLGECGVRIVLVDPGSDTLAEADVERVAVTETHAADLPEAGLDDLAYVIYTSGSTGAPKGVMVAHRGLANLIRTHVAALEVTTEDVILLAAAPTFDPWVFQVGLALAAGATLVVAGDDQVAGAPLAALVADRGVTLLNVTPTTAATLPDTALPALRAVLLGGDTCRLDTARRWAAGRTLYNAYGPTEATVSATLARFRDTVDHVHIGSPFPHARVYLLDERMRPVAPGVVGEICIGGVGVAWGYLGQPALTAERFRPDPFTDVRGARLYRTGDLGRLRADGGIDFLGRRDRQLKIRGYRIEPAEIEAVLTATPGVGEAVVVPHTDPTGDTRLIGYVTPDRPTDADGLAALARFAHEEARRALPRWMTPGLVLGLAGFPTRHGKINRAALPEPVWCGTGDRLPAATPTEVELTRIWARLLPAEPARDDDFFLRGGHSLLATRLVFAVAESFGVEMSLRTAFEHSTLAEQAAWIDRAVEAELATLSEDLLAEIDLLEQLDDAEVAALLSEWNTR